MDIDNVKETSFNKDVNNFPQTSDDNVLNKLDGFYDDTRLLGIELTLKALSSNKINDKSSVSASGSVAPVAYTYVTITTATLSKDVARRWLVFAIFDASADYDAVVTCRVRGGGIDIGKAIRYNAKGGGGATFAFETYLNSSQRTYTFESSVANTGVGNLRVDVRMVPLGG